MMTNKSSTSISRHRTTSHHANANSYNTATQRTPIVAIEPGLDDSRSMRIDQGLIDASNEAIQNQKSTSSWWSSFYGQEAPVTVDQPKPHIRALSAPDISSNTASEKASHRRIVSKTTYRTSMR
jgi:hypothetical protein